MDAPLPESLVPSFEEFFAEEHTRPAGQDVYHDVFNHGVLFPLQRQREMAAMMRRARSIAPRVVYEIGADKGGGLYHWCKSLPSVQRVICCEHRGTPYQDAFEKAFPHLDFLWLPASSYASATLRTVRKWLGPDLIDALFIDGDKSNFIKDFDVHRPLMRSGGIVFMHDIQDELTGAAFHEVVARGYQTDTVIDITDSHEAMARAAAGLPPSSPHEQWLLYWKGASAGVGIVQIP